jgi:RNA polymerase sigma factor (sigma-70 family)
MNSGHSRALEPLEPHDSADDGELLQRVRDGDETAYGELWARHVRLARRVAAGLVPAADVEDIVSEAFERTLAAIRGGNGPRTSFSSYVVQTMRARAATMYARSSRVSLADNDEVLDRPVEDPDPFAGAPARGRVARAFQDLPPRWQHALWLSVVEAEPPRRVADRLGTSPNGVSALVIRARRRLRANFIDLSSAESRNPLCSKAIAAPRRHAEHLSSCDHCEATLEGLADLDVRLNARGTGVLALLILGLGRLRAAPGWARSAGGALPAKAVAAVVVVTAGVAITPLVHPLGHDAAPAVRISSAAPPARAPLTPAERSRTGPRLGPSPVAPDWSAHPARRVTRPVIGPLRPARPAPVAQPAPRPASVTTVSHPTLAPTPPPATARHLRPLSLRVWSSAECECAHVRVRAAHRRDVVRIRTRQQGTPAQLLVLHPAHRGMLRLTVTRSPASAAPMVVRVSVRRHTTVLRKTVVVRAP